MRTTSSIPTSEAGPWESDSRRTAAATSDGAKSFWDTVAETRWGRYITMIERETLLSASDAFDAPGTALDVGCEGGRWTRLLCDRGWRVIAIDVDPSALRICQQKNPSASCALVGAQDDGFPVGAESIDLLISLEVPVVDQAWFPAEAKRVLKPGGMLVGSFMNRLSWRGMAMNCMASVTNRPRQYPSSYTSFRKNLRRQGIVLVEQCGCCWPPFTRKSNSRWIPIATAVERAMGLRRLAAVSPWIVFAAVRG